LGEFVGDVDTEAVDDRDDRKSDERRDQAIFNGGGAALIRCESMPLRNLRLRKFRLVNFVTSDGADGAG
jgi:hypothetical protein